MAGVSSTVDAGAGAGAAGSVEGGTDPFAGVRSAAGVHRSPGAGRGRADAPGETGPGVTGRAGGASGPPVPFRVTVLPASGPPAADGREPTGGVGTGAAGGIETTDGVGGRETTGGVASGGVGAGGGVSGGGETADGPGTTGGTGAGAGTTGRSRDSRITPSITMGVNPRRAAGGAETGSAADGANSSASSGTGPVGAAGAAAGSVEGRDARAPDAPSGIRRRGSASAAGGPTRNALVGSSANGSGRRPTVVVPLPAAGRTGCSAGLPTRNARVVSSSVGAAGAGRRRGKGWPLRPGRAGGVARSPERSGFSRGDRDAPRVLDGSKNEARPLADPVDSSPSTRRRGTVVGRPGMSAGRADRASTGTPVASSGPAAGGVAGRPRSPVDVVPPAGWRTPPSGGTAPAGGTCRDGAQPAGPADRSAVGSPSIRFRPDVCSCSGRDRTPVARPGSRTSPRESWETNQAGR